MRTLLICLSETNRCDHWLSVKSCVTYLSRFSSQLDVHRLLSDAEIAEDVIQDVLGVDGPCDGSEVMQPLSDVARD